MSELDEFWRRDSGVRAQIANDHPVEASLAARAVRLIASGIRASEGTTTGRAELVMGMAAIQVHNSLRGAVGHVLGGYPVQALALVRLANEYLTLFLYMRRRPEEAEGWLDFTKETPKRAGELAQVVFEDDPEGGESFRETRNILHRFAHQDTLGLSSLHEGTEGASVLVWLGSNPNPQKFRVATYFLLTVAVLAIDSLSRWVGDRDVSWAEAARVYIEECQRWRIGLEYEAERTLRSVESAPEGAS